MTYEPIDPTKGYNVDEFKDAFGKLKGIRGGLEILARDNGNPDAIMGLGGMLHDNPQYPYTFHNESPSEHMRFEGKTAAESGESRIVDYVTNNADEVYDVLDRDSIVALLTNVDPIENSEDEKYKGLAKALGEHRRIVGINGNRAKMKEYVVEKMEGAPEWLKTVHATYTNVSNYLERLFAEYTSQAMKGVSEKLESIDDEDMKRFGNMALENARETTDRNFFRVLGEVAYAQMAEQ